MRVVLVNPPDEMEAMFGVGSVFIQKYEPLGILYIAAVAREAGHEVEVIDAYAEGLGLDEVERRLLALQPEVVGFSTLTCSGTSVYLLGKKLKEEHPEILVVLGNVHASVFAEAYLKNGCCDLVVHGEGEYIFRDLLVWRERGGETATGRGLEALEGVSFLAPDGALIRTPGSGVIHELAELPFPARDLVKRELYHLGEISNQNYVGGGDKVGKTMMTSRGCPYRCTFCVVHQGHKQRRNSVEQVVDELQMLEEEYGATYVYLMDPLFMADRKRVFAICEEIQRRGLKVEWGCDANVKLLQPELVEAMDAGGCVELSLGIESGVQRLLDIVDKRTTLEEVRTAVRNVQRHSDIQIEGLFILGLPTETAEESLETIRFATELKLDMAQFSILCPYPGSKLFEELSQKGELQTGVREDGSVDLDVWRRYSSYLLFTDNEPIWVTPTQTADGLRRMQKRALRAFYLTPRQIWRQARRVRPDNVVELVRVAFKGFF
ncbi:MAG: radical SAM protein [Deltaproteobacteria bacterium]|nr:radical SAM protein [Deltaproteobacteria bacterium]